MTTLLSVLGLAVLFALFGWMGVVETRNGCAGCSHTGCPDCGAGCPLLRELPDPPEQRGS